MLFVDHAGSRLLPFTERATHCAWSASLETEAGRNDLLLKVVNKSPAPERVNIILTGARGIDPLGHYSLLTAPPEAENSLANPTRVVPSSGTFPARPSFSHLFPAYSITALRVGLSN
jgi:alpha-L-arabinofuranosidase